MIWLIIALVVVVIVACALGLYVWDLRREREVWVEAAGTWESAAGLWQAVSEQKAKTIRTQAEALAVKSALLNEANAGISALQTTLASAQVELRRSARLSMQAAAEMLDLRLELQQVRRRELPVLSDIRKGIPDASYRSERTRS